MSFDAEYEAFLQTRPAIELVAMIQGMRHEIKAMSSECARWHAEAMAARQLVYWDTGCKMFRCFAEGHTTEAYRREREKNGD